MAWKFYNAFLDSSYKAQQGPLPCKRWVKCPGDKPHKVPARSRTSTGCKVPVNVDLMAENYARWLAARDGIAIDPSWTADLVSGWVTIGTRVTKWGAELPKQSSRTRAVCFGIKHSRNWRGQAEESTEKVRIEIPNWDWVPAEPVEETLDSPALVPETVRELEAAYRA